MMNVTQYAKATKANIYKGDHASHVFYYVISPKLLVLYHFVQFGQGGDRGTGWPKFGRRPS